MPSGTPDSSVMMGVSLPRVEPSSWRRWKITSAESSRQSNARATIFSRFFLVAHILMPSLRISSGTHVSVLFTTCARLTLFGIVCGRSPSIEVLCLVPRASCFSSHVFCVFSLAIPCPPNQRPSRCLEWIPRLHGSGYILRRSEQLHRSRDE